MMEVGHTRLSDLHCPYCSAGLSYADAMPTNKNATPTTGAISICFSCLAPSIFVDGPFGLAVRKPTADEQVSIMAQIGPALIAYKSYRVRESGLGGDS